MEIGVVLSMSAAVMLVGVSTLVLSLVFLRRWLRGPIKSETIKKRLDGKVVVITGGNTGIGKETAKDLSNRGAKVLLLCRDVVKAKKAAEEISTESDRIVEVEKLDLASLESVRECAKRICETQDQIDILINNAGIMMCPYWKTTEGFEMQFGTNHLGHFLLTELLRPKLEKSAASGFVPRVVIVSSIAHYRGQMHWDDINFEKTSYNSISAYGQSKLANVLHAKALAEKLEPLGINVYSLHPGVVFTELFRHVEKKWYGKLWFLLKPFIKTPFHGAQTTLYCSLEDSIENETGKYYSDCREETPSPRARNRDDQNRLWELSEKLVKIKKS